MLNRRRLLQLGLGGALAGLLSPAVGREADPSKEDTFTPLPEPIDRHALVARHAVTRTKSSLTSPLQVGNGHFAFGADITGLQTFVPFNTMSDWSWHSFPLPPGPKPSEFTGQVWDTHGRPVAYPIPNTEQPELGAWMYANPRRFNLGRLGLHLVKADGTDAKLEDLTHCRQTLDLWSGLLTSRFVLEGHPVTVETACDPDRDAVAVRITSPLIKMGRLSVNLDFPGDDGRKYASYVGSFDHPERHETTMTPNGARRADFARRLDATHYHAALAWTTPAVLHGGGPLPPPSPDAPAAPPKPFGSTPIGAGAVPPPDALPPPPPTVGPHHYSLTPKSGDTLDFVCAFSPQALSQTLPDAAAVFAASAAHWPQFWKSGGAIDLSESRDPRWKELERRIVLSQYLLAVNEAGSLPPQESGLVNNGWHGKFHMEMYWWHGAHYALWNRWPLLYRSLGVYDKFLPSAEARAHKQGYKGARWPKMTAGNGQESPAKIQALLAWQMPHPIFLAELDYRAHPTKATLEKWRNVVFETADFLASYAFWDAPTKRYVLGPPMYVVSENTDPKITQNPAFELAYWRFGLRLAQTWRQRLGLAPDAGWERVRAHLSPLPVQDGVYVLYEGVADMWTKWNYEHPALIGTYGWLPGDGVDLPTLRRTAKRVFAEWHYEKTWGWDFPMLAMCAARLGDPAQAVDFLLHPAAGFQFDDAGLATGGPFPYFPSNGGLLYAAALMAAGWDGAPKTHAPGFPGSGQWTVRYEGLSRAI